MECPEFLRKWRQGESLSVEDVAEAIESLFNEMDAVIEQVEKEQEAPMGAFDQVAHITIPNPDDPEASKAFRRKWRWEPHEQVMIRGQFTTADQEFMENASSGFKGEGRRRQVEVRAGSARRALLERMIVDWTLTQNGRKVDVTAENIGRLPANYRTPILEACDDIAMVMDEEAQHDFLPSANGHSTEVSVKTK